MSALRRRGFVAGALGAAATAAFGGGPSETIGAEFDPVSALWLSAAPGHEALTRGLAGALAPHVALRWLVPDAAAAALAQTIQPRADITLQPGAPFFLRDLAVFAHAPGAAPRVIDLRASRTGAAAWCLRRHPPGSARDGCSAHARRAADAADDGDRVFAQRIGAELWPSTLALEGGGIEHNGRGLLIASAQLHASRNPGLTPAQLEHELKRLPGVAKVVWVEAGLAEDVLLRSTIVGPYVGWGAGGHTDQFVRFADPRTVLLAMPDADDPHPVARLTRERMQRNRALLAAATDVRGRRLRVVTLPMPRVLQRRVMLADAADAERSEHWSPDWFAPREGRAPGQSLWQVATASYLNFVVANGVVVLPDYARHGTPSHVQDRVARTVGAAFAGREVAFVDATSANWVGGGPHCATLNQP